MAPGTGIHAREREAGGGAPKLHQAAFQSGLLGLAAASAAITMAVRDKTTYLLALSGAFFAGVAHVTVTVSVWAGGGRRHSAGMKKLVYASLVIAAGLTVASLLP